MTDDFNKSDKKKKYFKRLTQSNIIIILILNIESLDL